MNVSPPRTSVTLAVEGVSKTFPQRGKPPLTVLDHISLQVGAGEFVSVVGPSGSGKSTLLSIIAGLDDPTEGSIALDGDVNAPRLGEIGYMPQRDLLLPWRSALENAQVGMQVQGVPKREARQRAQQLFGQFGLADFERSAPHELSGGMRQRVAFARTVLAARNLMLLDEPFGALDALTRLAMQRWLLDIWGQLGKAAILVTHDPEEALLLADRVYVFSARPARVVLALEVALPRPRQADVVGTPAFAQLKARLLRALLTGQDAPLEALQDQEAPQEVTLMKLWQAIRRAWPPVVLLFLLLACWQLYVQTQHIDQLILPAPLHILSATITNRSIFLAHIGTTLYETLVGLAVSLAFGVLTAALIDLSPLLRRAIYPLLVASQAIPIVAIAPLLIFFFGFGLLPKVIVVTLICFFPITVSMADGLRSTDPELMKLYRTFGAGELTIFWRVRLPHALPSFFSGLRIAATYAVVGAFLSEYVGAIYGLGILLQYEEKSFRTDLAFGDVIITALLSISLFALVSVIERIALPWYFAAGRERDWHEVGHRPKRRAARLRKRTQEQPAAVQAEPLHQLSTQGKDTL